MARRSTIETLPPELKAWLDAELLRRGFGDYVELARALTAQGVEVSKSSLHRYGSRFEERMAQLRASTEQARALVAASPDDEGALNEALIRLTQDKLFTLLVDMEIDPKKVDISKITKSIADVAKSSVLQKKWQVDMRARVLEAATEVEQTARKAGMSDETIDLIRQKILGVVDQPRKAAA